MVTVAFPAKYDAPSARRTAARVVLLALLVLASCRSTSQRAASTLQREIEAQNRALEQLFRAGNLLGVADVYGDDATMINARGERTVGREEIDAYWSAIESPVDWTLSTRSLRGSQALAYQIGTSRLTTRRDGALSTSVTEFLLLWQREADGAWRIALDAFWPKR